VALETYRTNLTEMVRTLKKNAAHVVLMTSNPISWTESLKKLYSTAPYVLDDPDGMNKALSKAVARVNADVSVIEKVRRFIVADEAFSVDNEMLTPSMKIRRHVIGKAYGERLDALYKK